MADRPPQSAIEALQQAVVARLKADPAVKALVQARVYDEIPSDQDRPKPPYVYIGPIARRRVEGGTCMRISLATVRLYAVSTDFGRLEAWSVIEACTAALDNKELPVADGYSTLGEAVRVIQDGDVIAPVSPKSTFADFSVTLQTLGE